MLQITTIRIATNATIQLAEQLSTADCDKVNPIEIMIGPVTTGGKNFITFLIPNILINAANTKYNNDANTTPKQAYGRSSRSPFGAIAPYPAKNAKEEPKNAGTFPLVRK